MPILSLLAIPIWLASVTCDILIIIKIFKANQVGLGVLAIFCPLFTFIYGWMKANEWGTKQIMLIWSALVGVSILLNIIVMVTASHG